jgi:hypothetical protein
VRPTPRIALRRPGSLIAGPLRKRRNETFLVANRQNVGGAEALKPITLRRLPHIAPCNDGSTCVSRQHFLNFLPLPHGHGSFRPIFLHGSIAGFVGAGFTNGAKFVPRWLDDGAQSDVPSR